jgi:hypothetical protein
VKFRPLSPPELLAAVGAVLPDDEVGLPARLEVDDVEERALLERFIGLISAHVEVTGHEVEESLERRSIAFDHDVHIARASRLTVKNSAQGTGDHVRHSRFFEAIDQPGQKTR